MGERKKDMNNWKQMNERGVEKHGRRIVRVWDGQTQDKVKNKKTKIRTRKLQDMGAEQ